MPAEIIYPGVYVEEVSGDPQTIAGVETSTAAFAGWAPLGPSDHAEPVASWSEFENKFGGLDTRSLLGYSVSHFFENGGRKAYIVKLVSESPLRPNEASFEDALLPPDGTGGLYNLDRVDHFNLLCVPGETNAPSIAKLQRFCLDRRAFLIADCRKDARFADVLPDAQQISGPGARNSAFYFPWVLAADPLDGNRPAEFPPCGFVAGIYSRTDWSRGVWKAPAGVSATLKGAMGLAADKRLNDNENGVLNPKAINCIRTFPTNGTVVWGARTLNGADAAASEWKYVPVRRTALFIEESLQRGLKWVVFEPNDEPLWAKIRLNVGTFMHALFRQGAFQGQTPGEAYFIKCDRDTTSQADIDNGVVNIFVGFAPLKPAEFVVIKLQQMTKKKDDDD